MSTVDWEDGLAAVLFMGDDWSEDHHDVEVQDSDGRVLATARLPEGVAGFARLHALLAEQVGPDTGDDEVEVVVGIETDRGPWVAALAAAGYQVYPLNPLQVSRFRDAETVSGAKSDRTDAHAICELVRLKRNTLRPAAGDSPTAEAVKIVTRAHKGLIWERTRHLLRLRHGLRDYFPAALAAFDDLTGPDALELLALAPDPVSAAALPMARIEAALRGAHRHDVAGKAEHIATVLRAKHLDQPEVITSAYAATTRAQVAILTVVATQIAAMQEQVKAHFGRHPDREIYLSQPGLGTVLAARVLAEFGDDKTRYADAKARKNYAGTSPITRQSGKRKIVMARYVHNDRLVDALGLQAFAALRRSPGAHTYYNQLRARGAGHHAALRQLGNRLVGILHGCLKTGTLYNETTAWHHHQNDLQNAA